MFNIPVNCDGNKLSACHKMANILTVSRKSFHLIDALWISLVLRPFTAERYDLDRKDGTFLNLFGGEIKKGIFCLDTNDFERGRITDVFLLFFIGYRLTSLSLRPSHTWIHTRLHMYFDFRIFEALHWDIAPIYKGKLITLRP